MIAARSGLRPASPSHLDTTHGDFQRGCASEVTDSQICRGMRQRIHRPWRRGDAKARVIAATAAILQRVASGPSRQDAKDRFRKRQPSCGTPAWAVDFAARRALLQIQEGRHIRFGSKPREMRQPESERLACPLRRRRDAPASGR